MLNRITTTSQTLLPRGGPASWRQELLSGQASWLPKLVVLLIAGCCLTSLYLWQASSISTMRTQVMQLGYTVAELEQANVSLVMQMALWNAPGYIDERSEALKLPNAPAPLRVRVAQQPTLDEIHRRPAGGSVTLWRRLTGWMSKAGVVDPATTAQAR